MTSRAADVDGYLTGTGYPPTWQPFTSPAWLDHVAAHAGFTPPRRTAASRFRYCELGCGRGWTLNLLAAANPHARFLGIDAMAEHVREARRVARAAGLDNVEFRQQTFATALRGRHAPFDYVAAHGVYTWVSDDNAARLFAFARRFLTPRGLLYLGYNVEPGWSALRPLRAVVIEHAARSDMASAEAAAREGLQLAEHLREAGAAAFRVVRGLSSRLERAGSLGDRYLAHEFLPRHWRPVFVGEALARAADSGLRLVGTADLGTTRPEFCLRRAERDLVDAAADRPWRELLNDLCLNRSFRTDVFTAASRTARPPSTWRRRLGARYALVQPRADLRYESTNRAGRLRFDNRAARVLVAALAAGPRSVAEVAGSRAAARLTEADLLYALDALLAAGLVLPVDPARRAPAAARLNAVLRAGAVAGDAPAAQVTGHGVALPVTLADLVLLDAPAGRRARVRRLLEYRQAADLAADDGQEDLEAVAEREVGAHRRRRQLYRLLGIV